MAPHGVWQLPGTSVASDPELAERLADGIEGLELDAEIQGWFDLGVRVKIPDLPLTDAIHFYGHGRPGSASIGWSRGAKSLGRSARAATMVTHRPLRGFKRI